MEVELRCQTESWNLKSSIDSNYVYVCIVFVLITFSVFHNVVVLEANVLFLKIMLLSKCELPCSVAWYRLQGHEVLFCWGSRCWWMSASVILSRCGTGLRDNRRCMGFEIFTAVENATAVLWVMMPCKVVTNICLEGGGHRSLRNGG
jgi:hypothetical protein